MIRPVTWVLALWLFAGSAAIYLGDRLAGGWMGGHSSSVMFRLIGSAKEAVGDTMYRKADQYHHGGVSERFELLFREGKGPGESHLLGHDPAEPFLEPEAWPDNWIRRVNRRIKVYAHRHLEEADEKVEVLPFLFFATRLNPHHIEAILTEAYWLGRHLGRVDQAIETLERGIRNNPTAWVLDYELGKIYFHTRKDYAQSLIHLENAIRKSSLAPLDQFDRHVVEDVHFLAQEARRLQQ